MILKKTNISKLFYKAVLFLSFFILLSSSCSIFHGGRKSDKQVQKEAVKKQNKAIDEEVKAYDKAYNEQTDRQTKEERKKIKKSRRKPKHMKSHKQKKQGHNKNNRTFFLWRWLGI